MGDIPKTTIDGATIMRTALANGLGLLDYEYIMKNYNNVIIPNDLDFQKRFNYFYRIRRSQDWRTNYYQVFESIKKGTPSFEEILSAISCYSDEDKRVEASFASKMLATINPNMPILDRKVLTFWKLKINGSSPSEKQYNAINTYYQLVDKYQKYLTTDEAKKNVELFDQNLPDYRWLTRVKKIDCLIWAAE